MNFLCRGRVSCRFCKLNLLGFVHTLLCLALFPFASSGQRSTINGNAHEKTLRELLEWLSVMGIVIRTSECTVDDTEIRIKVHPTLLPVGGLSSFHSLRKSAVSRQSYCPALAVLPPDLPALPQCSSCRCGFHTLPGFSVSCPSSIQGNSLT